MKTQISEAVAPLNLRGSYFIEHRNKAGKLIGLYRVPNAIVDEGMEDLLDVTFGNSTQSATWYVGLIDNGSYSGVADSDTLTSHAGWIENNDYTGVRKTWAVGAPATRSISNSTTADFAINGTATLRGIFICNVSSGTGGILWSTALFSSTVSVQNGDTLKITYTVSG